jgi:putative hydrolase of HD superfamily
VAEHSWRTAVIGYILAKMENYPNPYEVSTICVFHDIAESRIGDLHRVAKRYVKVDKEKAIKEQTQQLGETGEEIAKLSLRSSYKDLNDKAGIIARDADLVEQAISAYELVRKGYKSAEEWIENVKKNIKTKSAKELLNEMEKKQVDPFFWWEGLKVKKAD